MKVFKCSPSLHNRGVGGPAVPFLSMLRFSEQVPILWIYALNRGGPHGSGVGGSANPIRNTKVPLAGGSAGRPPGEVLYL